jgi:hypothetical protein
MKTVVAEPAWVPPALFVGFPVLGAGACLLIMALADWYVSLGWRLLRGPAAVVSSIAEPWGTIGAIVVGVVAGLVIAALAVHESLTVAVDDHRVELSQSGGTIWFDRPQVAAAYVDNKQLVLVGPDTKELTRSKSDLDRVKLRDAFITHGYPWQDEDPYRVEFRRWVEGTPNLPPAANSLLRARATALAKGDTKDATDLRTELADLGVVVRDERKRQFWRNSGPQMR